jgi:holin-like protein
VIRGLLVLLACQLLGEALVALLDLPVPGPVVGMVVLLALLTVWRPGPDAGVVRVAEGLLRHLQLLFVPAGAGVFSSLSLIGASVVPLVAGLVLSWGAALVSAAGVALLLLRFQGVRRAAR